MTGGFPAEMDAFFLIDGSGSISDYEEFHHAKYLVSQVIMKMNIAPDKVREAVPK